MLFKYSVVIEITIQHELPLHYKERRWMKLQQRLSLVQQQR